MTGTSYCTPLIGLNAVVLDTEATGLDAAAARIVQVAAVKVHGGVIEKYLRFDRLVNPGVPIPPAAIRVHGITDADVAGAPAFQEIWPDLESFLGDSVVIGHTTGYDLALLERECRLAGLKWGPRRSLCIRRLAEIVAPNVADLSLDSLCAWLEIEIEGRHTAMGDAEATAKAFVALLPLLRAKDIRTLAEAQAAIREAAEREARNAGGLIAGREKLARAASENGDEFDRLARGPLMRADSYPYRHRVREIMAAPVILVSPETSVRAAARLLSERKVGSAFVDLGGDGSRLGIVTERDIMRAVAADGGEILEQPIGKLANAPLQSISDEAFLYRAIGRMQRLGFRHLGVHNARGEIVGALSMRDLLRYRATAAIMLGDEIDSADSVGALGQAWARLPLLARTLMAEEVKALAIANIISSEVRVLTRRAGQLAEERMIDAGRGQAPVPYALLVLGSAGRGETLLAADQDNAIVFASGEPGGQEDKWFEEYARHLADILDEVGVPYCKGGVMARNAQWRMSAANWKATIEGWVRRQRPEDLLNVDIFFDGITVGGDTELGDGVWDHAYDCGAGSPSFLKLLTETARAPGSPAFTLLGGFKRDEDGRMDLKKAGLFPIIATARLLAIKHGARVRETPARYRAVEAMGAAPPSDVERLIGAQETILEAILGQQLADIADGIPPGNRVATGRLGRKQKAALRSALSDIYIAADLAGEGRF